MSFATKIKEELALNDSLSVKDELSALFKINGNLTISSNKYIGPAICILGNSMVSSFPFMCSILFSGICATKLGGVICAP